MALMFRGYHYSSSPWILVQAWQSAAPRNGSTGDAGNVQANGSSTTVAHETWPVSR